MKQVRFAVVGFGNIAKTHMVALKTLPVIRKLPFIPVLDTLITRDPDSVREQAEAIGFAHVTSFLEDALQTRPIDVVDICTPNALHLDAAKTAIQAGKTLYLEKPLTDRYTRSKELAGLSGEDNRHQVALVFRYHPAVIRLKEILRQGLIGEPLQCRISYRRSGYLNAARPISWRLDQELSGGGAITDLGVHVLDLLFHLFGDFQSVSGKTNTFVKERPRSSSSSELVSVKVDDWALMDVVHQSGVLAIAEVSRIAWGAEAFQIDVVGTKGSAGCDLEKDYVPQIKLLDGSSPASPYAAELSLSADEKTTMGTAVDCHLAALNHFLHRFTGHDKWPEDLAPAIGDCLRAEYWIDQVIRSIKN